MANAMFWDVVRLAIVLLGSGALLFALTTVGMAFALLRPPRMTDGKATYFLKRLSPQDLELSYESIPFKVRDQWTGKPLRMAGWWIPAAEPSEKCVIVLHGYTDAKIGGIAWAPLLRSMGFNVLAIDLRAHGQSQGMFTTAGYYERHDVSQVIDQIKASYPDQTRRIVLFGASLGCAVAGATALLRKDIAAVVMESPYRDFPSAVLSHADNLGVPGRIFQRAAIAIGRRMTGADFSEVAPINVIGKIRCPLYVVQSGEDPFVPPDQQAQIAAAVEGRASDLGISRIWMAEGCFHITSMGQRPDEFRRRLADFLSEALLDQPARTREKEVCPP
ncbi:MAG: alpha/beta hydrolase [Tepidisphaeraceae bacterium]